MLNPVRNEVPADRKPVAVKIAGAGRGATHVMPFLAELDRGSMALAIRPEVISPRADELARIAALAKAHGLDIITTEAKIQDVLAAAPPGSVEPLIINVDRPRVAAEALAKAAESNRPVLLHMFLQLPGRPLMLIAAILTRYQKQLKRDLATFFEVLGKVTAPNGSDAVFGDGAPADNIELEPAQRAWINDHIATNLLKVVVDLEPNTAPVQMVVGGEARTLLLVKSPNGFRSIEDVEADVTEHLIVPLERGKDFVVAEIGRDAIRFHDGRLRTDGRLIIRSGRPTEPEAVETEGTSVPAILRPFRALFPPPAPTPTRERVFEESRFGRQTVTRMNASFTSD